MSSKKEPETIVVDTLDQKLLIDILGELQAQRRIIRAMNRTVQVIGLIIFLTLLASCFVALFGLDVLF